MTDPNAPAFSEVHVYHWRDKDKEGEYDNVLPRFHSGLTKREYFAGLAMQGMLAAFEIHIEDVEKKLASASVRYADALIAELSK